MKKLSKRETYNSSYNNDKEYEKQLVRIENFNEQGKLILSQEMGPDEEPVVIEERIYDDGQLVEIRSDDLGMSVNQITEFKYTENRIVEEIEHFENNTYLKRILKYDEDQRLIEILQTDEENAFLGKTDYSYAPLQVIVKKYDEENSLYIEHRRVYDELENEVEHEMTEYLYDEYKKEMEETRTWTKREYEGSNLIKEEAERYGKIIFTKMNEYDASNNLIKTVVKTNEADYIITLAFQYNSQNKLISETRFNNQTEIYSKHLEYDSEMHLIEVIENSLAQDGFIVSTKKSIEITYH